MGAVPELPVRRGVAAAFLVVVAVVFAVVLRAAVAGAEEAGVQVILAVAGAAAVVALLVAAVQLWRERRWWPWVALHVALITVATVAALIASPAGAARDELGAEHAAVEGVRPPVRDRDDRVVERAHAVMPYASVNASLA